MSVANAVEPTDLIDMTTENSLNIFHLSIRPVKSKTDNLAMLLSNRCACFDAVRLTEAWHNYESFHFMLRNGQHFVLNRKEKNEDRVSIQLLPTRRSCILEEYSCITNIVEITMVLNKNCVFTLAYHLPNFLILQIDLFLWNAYLALFPLISMFYIQVMILMLICLLMINTESTSSHCWSQMAFIMMLMFLHV